MVVPPGDDIHLDQKSSLRAFDHLSKRGHRQPKLRVVLLVFFGGCSLFGSEPNTLQIYSALFGPIIILHIPNPPYLRTRLVTTSNGSTFQNLSYAPIDSARRELSNAYMKSLFRHPPSKSVFSVAEKNIAQSLFVPSISIRLGAEYT